MDILPDGTLVAATWNGYSNMKQEWFDHGYVKGGYVLTYNIYTGIAESHGIPMYGDSWPNTVVDKQTGVLLAGGRFGTFMAYDVRKKKLLYGGMPTDGITWDSRTTILDERTGMAYTTDSSSEDNQFVSYDQLTNEFRRLDCYVPKNPVTGKSVGFRAYAAQPTFDKLFYCVDSQGTIFTFSPEEEKTEFVDINWGESGIYTPSIAMSPKCRYLYYLSTGYGEQRKLNTPVIQYDIKTKQKKVIAFLAPYYEKKYGYSPTGTFGIELSEDGSLLVIHMNGGFVPNRYEMANSIYASIFAIHIPESERQE